MSDQDRPEVLDQPSEWTVRFSPAAVRAVWALPSTVVSAVVRFVTGTLPEDPWRLSEPLRGELASWRVGRRGDYRVFLQIDEPSRILRIGMVEHRAHSYRHDDLDSTAWR